MNLEKIKAGIAEKCPLAKQITIGGGESNPFCKELYFITVDALESKDWENDIARNSVYMQFNYDDSDKSLELHTCGHVYPSESDLKTPTYQYLCMKPMTKVHADFGGKKFRKTKAKTEDDLIKKISAYFNAVMVDVVKYTGGYPYKKGI